MTDAQRGLRVLVVAPTPKDSRITVDILEQAGCNVAALRNVDELCAGIRMGAGAVLLTDDFLRTKDAIKALASVLDEQPTWSDMPIVLVSREGSESPLISSILPALRNVLVLKQPVHIPTLISSVKSALRSRDRQYEIRDLLEEREKTQEELLHRERLMSEGQKIAHVGTFEYLADTRNTVWSDEEYRIYGLDPAGPSPTYDVMLEKCIHPEDSALLHRVFSEAMRNRSVYELEHRIVRPDGSVRIVHDRAHPYFDADGKLIRYIGATLDVTERKRAEDALRKSDRRLRVFFESDMFGAIFWNMDGRITDANDRFLRTVRYSREDLMSGLVNWSDLTPPEYEERDANAINELVTAGIDMPYEKEYIRKDGTRVPIIIGAVMLDDKRQEGVAFVLDITERKRAEEALRQSEERFRTMGEILPYGVWWCNERGEAEYASQSFLDLLEMTMQGIKEFGWTRRLPANEVEPMMKRWMHCVETGEYWDDEYHVLGPDGRYHAVLTRGRPIRDRQEKIIGWAGINLDIDDRKKSEEALARAKSELEQRVEERTAEIAHRADQLRALAGELTLAEQRERMRLAQILHDGLQQLLVAAKFHAATAERSRDIQKAVAEITDLLDDAIQTSRSLTSELSPPVLREGGLVPAVEWLVRWMHDKHGLDVRLTVRDNIDPLSEPVLLLLFQAIRELLFNVVKHAFVKIAEIELSMNDDQIEVSVRDEGVGFNIELLDSKRTDSGGFGLFSIRERLNLFGGCMEIFSSPGSGSVFKMLVPVWAAKTTTSPSKSTQARQVVSVSRRRASSGRKDKIRVVLVDDHIVMRKGIAGLIDGEPDLEVVGEASDGASAVKLVREIRPDVVLMDLSMPGMNGIEATQIIHTRHPEVRIIGLSMFEEKEKAAEMLQAGAAEYLTKSGPADDLIQAIRRSVGSEILKPEKPFLN